ncbi:GMP synthase [Pseudothermotoga hypogea DSM 11164 = NBRC 106472]|uniref:GMP synthase [glutamine-hydrolyzing] n=1 Tax=Pseudothermotoga hypogea DSM 11164 = NBRC 106472 TaxID=1123384 RepID=A0A0X1KR09_9THEM|nr:glutamine-hydrolyzing GMP synthase [Pseudothermotoga hypogea]AJC73748.1 GMP synthase [Pseudothermotoga hypogea DSM 11164 = NBRC 106472]
MKVLILDYGSQYTQLIARVVRELGYYSQVVQPDEDVDVSDIGALILSGGPASVYEPNAPRLPSWFEAYKGKVLGICYGMQLLAHEMGGKVEPGELAEYGRTEIVIVEDDPIFENVPRESTVWMSHSDVVKVLPKGFKVTAHSKNGMIVSASDRERFWLLQFHPEVRHTQFGRQMLQNFLSRICGLKPNWNLEDFITQKIEELRKELSGKKVIAALSGGVDSSVACVLVHRAIGTNLRCVFVDHGLLRKNEPEEVMDVFKNMLQLNVVKIDARERFLSKLKGVDDPEKKRKIIGEEFIRVFEQEAKSYGATHLVQGTIYSDVIESAKSGKKTAAIKSHHNVGGLPEKMDLKIVEPLRNLFKDEVRIVGEMLGIPRSVIHRQPFPGPGLAVRVIGPVDEEKLDILREADYILIETLRETGWYEKIWQAFAVLLPVRSVGVRGDRRAYDYVLAIRCVDSVEGMTADWSKIPHDVLDLISRRILNGVKGVGRVVYDISSKPPATIEWE